MLSNLDYNFYHTDYNNGLAGTIPEKDFSLLTVKAWRELEPLLNAVPSEEQLDGVLFAICEIAEELYRTESRQGIKSENIDGYSVTYADEVSIRRRVIDIAVRKLGDTGLLYMGVEGC